MSPRFQLISRIASGGFSTIDHVRSADGKHEFVLKRPKPGLPVAGAQLRTEAEVLGLIRHPNVVKLHEAGDDDEGAFLALEWINGNTLERRLPLDLNHLREVLAFILQALSAIHSAGFAHGDVNASNVLLAQDGTVKLIDLGNAGPLSDPQTRSIDQANIGSVHHMAPELFAGQPASVQADLYALGVVAYHAIAGRYPFDGDSNAQVITAHLRFAAAPLPSSLLSGWVSRMLSRDPIDRPASALDALQSLP